jgi:hypothetical protein
MTKFDSASADWRDKNVGVGSGQLADLLIAARDAARVGERRRIVGLIDEARSVLLVDEKRNVDDELVSALSRLMVLIDDDE